MEKIGKAYGAAKGDWAEAAHYGKGSRRRARATAKRDLRRAVRRAGKAGTY